VADLPCCADAMNDSVTKHRLGLPAEWVDAFQEQINMIDWGLDNETYVRTHAPCLPWSRASSD
jgi:hypothetical protein